MSELTHYLPIPEKDPKQFAKELKEKIWLSATFVRPDDVNNVATLYLNMLLNQGLLMPLNQYQIKYYNDVIKEINEM